MKLETEFGKTNTGRFKVLNERGFAIIHVSSTSLHYTHSLIFMSACVLIKITPNYGTCIGRDSFLVYVISFRTRIERDAFMKNFRASLISRRIGSIRIIVIITVIKFVL